MHRSPRVLVVTRRYWPQANDSTYRLQAWCSAISRQGASVGILMPCWSSQWPRSLTCREIPIWRVEPPPTSPFRIGRYTRSVTTWIQERASQFDLILCDAADIEAEAIAAIPSSANMPPLAVRFDPVELSATYCRDAQIPARAFQVCRRARLVIAPRATALQRLIAAGIPATKIVRMPDYTIEQIPRNDALRHRARTILGSINQELFLRSIDQLMVCPTDMDQRWILDPMIQALGPLLEANRNLRLWILGEGIYRSRVFETLKNRGWHNLVDLPGSFEDLEQIVQASDLWILPAAGVGTGWLIPTAIASGLPVLVGTSPEFTSILPGNHPHLNFSSSHAAELQYRVRDWLDQPQLLSLAAQRARQILVEQTKPLAGWDAVLDRL